MEIANTWWAWIVLAACLGVLEVLAPGYIFLGFAVSALAMAGVVALGLGLSLPVMILIFAVLAGIAWLGLRKQFGTGVQDVKVWHDDINDN